MVEIILWILFYFVGWVAVIASIKMNGFDIKEELENHKDMFIFTMLFSWLSVSVIWALWIILNIVKGLCYIAIKIDQMTGTPR